MKKQVLILSKRYSADSQKLYNTALQQGWQIWRFVNKEIPDWVKESNIAIYCETVFADYLAAELNLQLLIPQDTILANLPIDYVKRKIIFYTVKDFTPIDQAKFIKPADYKYFPAGIYNPGDKIPGFDYCQPNDPLLISDVVDFVNEYRFFVLDNKVVASSPYVLNKEFIGDSVINFKLDISLNTFTNEVVNYLKFELPKTYVIDVGQLKNGDYAIIEFNPVWASGIYGANAGDVLQCLKFSINKK